MSTIYGYPARDDIVAGRSYTVTIPHGLALKKFDDIVKLIKGIGERPGSTAEFSKPTKTWTVTLGAEAKSAVDDLRLAEAKYGCSVEIVAAAESGPQTLGLTGHGKTLCEPHDEGTAYCTSLPYPCPIHPGTASLGVLIQEKIIDLPLDESVKLLGRSRLELARDLARDALRAFEAHEPTCGYSYAEGAWFGAQSGRLAMALRNLLETL